MRREVTIGWKNREIKWVGKIIQEEEVKQVNALQGN